MLYLILITQNLLCLVSMALTGLFALSLSGGKFDLLSEQGVSGETLFLSVLFLVIGLSIDIGKYLFWAQRRQGRYFFALSLLLMFFSWLASCAFLVSSEANVINRQRIQSSEYKALLQQIDNVHQEINYQEQLVAKRLSSTYHQQWAEGENNVQTIAQLRASLVIFTQKLSEAGKASAAQQVPVTAFFLNASQYIGISDKTVRFLAFGLLSLLLELSTLGMISLVQLRKLKGNEQELTISRVNNINQSSFDEESVVLAQRAVIHLICDILSGKSAPVFRKIRESKYGLDVSVIRQVLRSLHIAGVLKEGKRNSYELATGLVKKDTG
jgi:hypothetical protein